MPAQAALVLASTPPPSYSQFLLASIIYSSSFSPSLVPPCSNTQSTHSVCALSRLSSRAPCSQLMGWFLTKRSVRAGLSWRGCCPLVVHSAVWRSWLRSASWSLCCFAGGGFLEARRHLTCHSGGFKAEGLVTGSRSLGPCSSASGSSCCCYFESGCLRESVLTFGSGLTELCC